MVNYSGRLQEKIYTINTTNTSFLFIGRLGPLPFNTCAALREVDISGDIYSYYLAGRSTPKLEIEVCMPTIRVYILTHHQVHHPSSLMPFGYFHYVEYGEGKTGENASDKWREKGRKSVYRAIEGEHLKSLPAACAYICIMRELCRFIMVWIITSHRLM